MSEEIAKTGACIDLQSVNRITNLQIVASTLQTSKMIFDKIKDYNSLTNWTISTAETTVYKAVEAGKPFAIPVVQSLKGPIMKVDGFICCGLDYVEAKIPVAKIPNVELKTCTEDKTTKKSLLPTTQLLQKENIDDSNIANDNLKVNGTSEETINVVELILDNLMPLESPTYEKSNKGSSFKSSEIMKEEIQYCNNQETEEVVSLSSDNEQCEDSEETDAADSDTNTNSE